eukprot:TRINITY_DN59728_c0_g1_i1.p2 TRINITY_DN59728_c0_g1~~TRINITY_DN59728_c0_g1_i1.p2  ORF type:complete len:126 (+),score=15.65 TRINITY_DN59728_c0_g1_i1:370-747(+)
MSSDDESGAGISALIRDRTRAERYAIQTFRARDREIATIENEVTDIHTCMVDLSMCLEDQEADIGTIDRNNERTHDRVSSANHELERAAETQARKRPRVILILLALIIVVAIVVGIKFAVVGRFF